MLNLHSGCERGIPRRHSSYCVHSHSMTRSNQNGIPNDINIKGIPCTTQTKNMQVHQGIPSGMQLAIWAFPFYSLHRTLSSHLVKSISHLVYCRKNVTSETSSASWPVKRCSIFQKSIVVIETSSTEESTSSSTWTVKHLGLAVLMDRLRGILQITVAIELLMQLLLIDRLAGWFRRIRAWRGVQRLFITIG